METQWKTINMNQMIKELNDCRDRGQYAFVWDKTGKVPMVFQYKAKLFDFGQCVIKQAMGQMTEDEMIEQFRANTVYSWRAGWM